MHILLQTVSGDSFELDVAPESTVAELKAAIALKFDLPPVYQKLLADADVLEDAERLDDRVSNPLEGMELTLVLMEMPGGGPPDERKPLITWYQRRDMVCFTIDYCLALGISHVQDTWFRVPDGGTSLRYLCRDKYGRQYRLVLDLHKPVKHEGSIVGKTRIMLKKASLGTWEWLTTDRRVDWIKPDFDKWVDSEDEVESETIDPGDMVPRPFLGVT
eukprot:TRINITY_DN82674_c0_g1_i1.p1 TRINITY_DN82674_c0_g1~~TRINITY_DN82674_c0_g1_i1.p1  ORF type:complete len:217 (-),score=45.29 TRINITY_DN82674_c0_g1_i1:30-680(-)